MRLDRRLAMLAFACLGCLASVAQNATISPYSRYGYGLLNDNTTSMQKAMGGVGYAMNSGRQINVMNPASYAAIDSLTFLFDMGLTLKDLHASDAGSKENQLTGGLDYITMSFPISKRIGASLGLLPFASTGYEFYNSVTNGAATHNGSGDISQLYLGAAYNPVGNFYIGFNLAYLFGSITNEVNAMNITGSYSVFQRYMSIRDWRLDLGVQYVININSDNRMTLGLAYSPAKDLHGQAYGIYYDGSLDSKADTIYGPGDTPKLNGNYSIPATYGGGVNYMWRGKLMIEADFLYQPWKDAKYATLQDFESTRFADRWKVAAGLQYTPSPRGNYAGRMQYRLGAYYNHDYLMVLGNNVREFGVSFGLGLPVPQFKTVINLAFEYKHRQAHPDPLVREQYFNVSLGVNFNELWFRKSRIY